MAENERLPMAAVQNILLDVAKDEEQVRVSIRRGDANRWVWRFCLLDDGVPLDLAGVDMACISIQKPDGTHIWNPCVINGDVIEYTVTSETVSVDGQLHGQVELYAGEMDAQGNLVPETLKTAAFRVVVLENVFGESTISSSNEYDMLTQAVAGVAALQKKFPVKTADVADGAVTEAKIANGAVSEGKIAQGLRTGILHTMYVHRLGNGAVLYYNYTGNDMDDVYVMARPFGGAALQTTGLDMDADAVMQNYANDSEAFGVVDACGQTLRYKDLPFFGDGQSRVILKLERANSRMVAVDVERGYTIPDGAVTTDRIGAGAVTEGKIADGAVTTNKLGYEAVTSGKISGDAVGTHHLQDGAVTAEKTSFATEDYVIGALIGTMDIDDTLYGRVSVTPGKQYLICPDGGSDTPPSSVMLEIVNSALAVIEQTPVVELSTISTVDATISSGRLVTAPAGASKMYLTTLASDTGIKYKVYPVAQHLLIPTLLVGSDQIDSLPDGVVTMPKLSAEVREALSGALRRKVVAALPASDGQVLVARNADASVDNLAKFGDLVSTNWVPLDSAADVTPIASTKRLRLTITLTKASGGGSYRSGQLLLRKWASGVETKASYTLPPAKLVAGAVDWDIPLTDFKADAAAVWGSVNQIEVFVYANNSTTPADGDYTITLSNVRIVDTAVQSELDLQTIYMVPSDDPQTGNVYDEYMYIGSAWERIGSTEVDLSGYIKLDDANMELSGIHVLTKRGGKWYDRQGIKYTLDTTRKVATVGDGTTDSDNAEYAGANDGTVIIPAKVCADGVIYRVEIGFYAFYGNTHISRLILSEGLTGDGSVSFQSCTALSEICFPSSITTISDYNFGYCNSLRAVHIPNTITTINNDAFEFCADGFTLYIDNYEGAVSIGTNNGTAVYLRANPADVKQLQTNVGDIDTALDSIIAVQNNLIGGAMA